MARYSVSLTRSGQHNFAQLRRNNFDSTDKRGREISGLTSHQLHAICTGDHSSIKRRYSREDR